ncbi:MAG: hypothetical protein WEB89_05440 [Balneolales bacterium]
MKNFVGVVLIIIGLGLILSEGERDQSVDEYVNEENGIEADRDPELADPGDGDRMPLQPILAIVFLLTGAGILVYAYNENKPVE